MMTEEDVVGKMLLFRRKSTSENGGGSDLTVGCTRPASVVFYVFYLVHTIRLLFCYWYWYQTAAIFKRLAERGGNAKKAEICPGRHPNLGSGKRRPVISHHAS